MTYFLIYLFTRINIILFLSILSLIGTGVLLILIYLEDLNKQYTKKLFVILFISLLLICIIPTRKELAFIYVVPKILNNKELANIPTKTIDLANIYLDNLIKRSKK